MTRLQNWLASLALTLSLIGLFTLVGTIERWGAEFDEAPPPIASRLTPHATDIRRVAVDISSCTPPWARVTPILEITIEVSSDLGWTAVGCTRFAHARAKPIPTGRVVAKADGVTSDR